MGKYSSSHDRGPRKRVVPVIFSEQLSSLENVGQRKKMGKVKGKCLYTECYRKVITGKLRNTPGMRKTIHLGLPGELRGVSIGAGIS